MSPFRRFAVAAVARASALSVLAAGGIACSSSSGTPPAVTPDAGAIDANVPNFCGLPIPSTCPSTAPCAFAVWKCAQAACDGYFVVTDGAWVYYYSAPGGELAGEVSATDAAFVSCPYSFLPPTGCTPAVASRCGTSTPDAG